MAFWDDAWKGAQWAVAPGVKLAQKYGGKLTERPGEQQQRAGLTSAAGSAAGFADIGQAGFGALGTQLGGETDYMRRIARGQESVSAEQLRQALGQNLSAQQSMAAGATPQNQAMAGLMASRNAMQLGSGLAGQQAVAGMQERQAAQSALTQALLQQRQQELNAALGGRQVQVDAFGRMVPGQSMADKAKPFLEGFRDLATSAAAASDIRVKGDIEDAGARIDDMLDNLTPISWHYLDPDKYGRGRHTGIIAQDLAKSVAGTDMLVTLDGGVLGVDHGKALHMLMASVARLNARVRELEAERDS